MRPQVKPFTTITCIEQNYLTKSKVIVLLELPEIMEAF